MVIEIRGVENGDLAVPVNNTLVDHKAFLAADTPPCVLIGTYVIANAHFNGLESVLEKQRQRKRKLCTDDCLHLPYISISLFAYSVAMCVYRISYSMCHTVIGTWK